MKDVFAVITAILVVALTPAVAVALAYFVGQGSFIGWDILARVQAGWALVIGFAVTYSVLAGG